MTIRFVWMASLAGLFAAIGCEQKPADRFPGKVAPKMCVVTPASWPKGLPSMHGKPRKSSRRISMPTQPVGRRNRQAP